MSADYFVDIDGYGDLNIWRHNEEHPNYPQPVLTQHDFRRCPELWDTLVAAIANPGPYCTGSSACRATGAHLSDCYSTGSTA